MEKKTYIIPCIQVTTVELNCLMDQFSGGGNEEGSPQIDPDPDNSNNDNRSRQYFNVWE